MPKPTEPVARRLDHGWLSDSDKRALQPRVRAYMASIAADCETSTSLAEAAAAMFDVYGPAPTYTIPEDLFEWALDYTGGDDL